VSAFCVGVLEVAWVFCEFSGGLRVEGSGFFEGFVMCNGCRQSRLWKYAEMLIKSTTGL
jgi:hypothetical protein